MGISTNQNIGHHAAHHCTRSRMTPNELWWAVCFPSISWGTFCSEFLMFSGPLLCKPDLVVLKLICWNADVETSNFAERGSFVVHFHIFRRQFILHFTIPLFPLPHCEVWIVQRPIRQLDAISFALLQAPRTPEFCLKCRRRGRATGRKWIPQPMSARTTFGPS